jgi:TolB-like protein
VQREQRRLAAILAADVAGFSRLMAADESRTLARLKSLRSDVIAPKIAEFNGRLVGSAGDSLLVEFSSVVDAVQCAIEMQGRLIEANRDLAENQRMNFRMGVNLGDVIAERVHNIPEPVHAFRVSSSPLIEGAGQGSSISSGKDAISVAILPFADMSRDRDQEYFADGLTEDLITELARSRQLSVVARNSTFTYKGKSVKAQEAGREFGAEFIVEGSVRKSGNQLRVTVQLIDCATGAHAWAERYDRKFEDIFALQDEIVTAIVARLAYNLEEAAVVRRRQIPTASVSAYEHFLRYRSALRLGDEIAAREHALEAIRIDPNYARALGALAALYSYEIFSRASKMPEADADRLSRDFAQRAVAADKSDVIVLTLAGAAYAILGDH